MSNHAGSDLTNNILCLLDENDIFKILGKKKTLEFLDAVRLIGCENDCNDGEILDVIGEKLKICYQCWEYSEKLQDGICNIM